MTLFDRKLFFSQVRPLFAGRLLQSQVEGVDGLLLHWEAKPFASDSRWLAYCLATAHHETGAAMIPLREKGGRAYLEDRYGPQGRNPARAKAMGNTEPGDGARFAGRGFVQLTWKRNYRLMSGLLSGLYQRSLDLITEPDLALEPGIAADILFHGMIQGCFSGRRLDHYFNPDREDWIGARAIVNGSDRAEKIAYLGRGYDAALQSALGAGGSPR